jgi:hypothetical protein
MSSGRTPSRSHQTLSWESRPRAQEAKGCPGAMIKGMNPLE